ncbi:MAG: DMT family transporter [Oscillospiraceae bacterium]|nr:DMT family transporter [Oscillospiraceae bacterium]MBR6678054.1 DMT family transporter [Oscillospiraceae bacterium]
MHPRIRQTVLPLLAAAIWGSAFVGQSIAGDYLPPFAVNAARSVVAVLTLAVVIWGFRRWETTKYGAPKSQNKRKMIIGGIACGTVLTIASNLQQIGLVDTSAGKASFITALYIVIVPLCSVFAGRRLGMNIWCAVALATAGLYFLCIQSGFTVQRGDFFVFLCALFFSAHILVIDHYTRFVDGIYLSFVQFFTCMVISGAISLLTEEVSLAGFRYWILPILYVGIFSSGIAYTLQIIAQTGTNPAVVSLLLSLESVFGVISGAIVLHERMSGREWLGCALMFAAVILSQLPERSRKPS